MKTEPNISFLPLPSPTESRILKELGSYLESDNPFSEVTDVA